MSRILTGTPTIDENTQGGIPSSDLTVIATSDDRTGSIALGRFLMSGLQNNETVLLVSFERMNSFFENFKASDFDFKKYYNEKKFLFFNFVPSIRHKVGFLQDYRSLFEEIYKLSGDQKPQRIAFHQVDTLMNLSNTHLAHLTADKLASACRSRTAQNATVMAQFIKFNDKVHEGMSVALQKSAAGYIELLKNPDNPNQLNLAVKKMPWFDFDSNPKKIDLNDLIKTTKDSEKKSPNAAA